MPVRESKGRKETKLNLKQSVNNPAARLHSLDFLI